MKLNVRGLFLAIAAVFSMSATAEVSVTDAWVRATVPNQQATGAFMQFSAPKEMRLVSAKSSLALSVELHEMAIVDNIMKMRQVPDVFLPAHKMVELKPGGFHVMLIGLRQQIRDGDEVPLTLTFEGKDGRHETQAIVASARALNSTAASIQRIKPKH